MYNGSQLTQMTVGNDTLHFVYDATGAPVIVVWNGVAYYYVTTLQGDVFMIMDEDGAILASYDYDAWGNVVDVGGSMASTLGTLNPLRYRGYVYDTETGLYYLQSRYYNPEIGRFINADAFVSTGQDLLGNNMFGYCSNNPATYLDTSGHAWHTFDERLYGINFMSGIVDSGGGGGGACSMIGTLGATVLIDLLFGQADPKNKEQVVVAVDAISPVQNNAHYYGVDLRGDIWRTVTPAMDYETAIAWTHSIAGIVFGKRSKWGLYTAEQKDALEMALALGGPGFVPHSGRIGEYNHYHVNGMLLFGQYKHFHIWYGAINMEG